MTAPILPDAPGWPIRTANDMLKRKLQQLWENMQAEGKKLTTVQGIKDFSESMIGPGPLTGMIGRVPKDTPGLREALQRLAKAREPERIVKASVRWAGKEYDGITHADAMLAAEDAGAPAMGFEANGFRTSTGRWVDRKEAQAIAKAQQQTKRPNWSELDAGNLLKQPPSDAASPR